MDLRVIACDGETPKGHVRVGRGGACRRPMITRAREAAVRKTPACSEGKPTMAKASGQASWSRTLVHGAALSASYFLLAAWGLRWATFRGAVSPVFPAAGAALAALLLGGLRLWPAVFVGSMATLARREAGSTDGAHRGGRIPGGPRRSALPGGAQLTLNSARGDPTASRNHRRGIFSAAARAAARARRRRPAPSRTAARDHAPHTARTTRRSAA